MKTEGRVWYALCQYARVPLQVNQTAVYLRMSNLGIDSNLRNGSEAHLVIHSYPTSSPLNTK